MLDPIVNFFTRVFQWIGRGIGFVIGIILWPFLWAGRWYAERGWILKAVLGTILVGIVAAYAYFFYVTQFWRGFNPDYPAPILADAAAPQTANLLAGDRISQRATDGTAGSGDAAQQQP